MALHTWLFTLGSSRDAQMISFAIHTRLIIQQLTDKAPVLLQEQLDRILDAPGTILFVARDASSSSSSNDGGDIIGMLTLCIFSTPTGTRATIGKRPPLPPPETRCPRSLGADAGFPTSSEDVVVDCSARGRGVGDALLRAALASSRDLPPPCPSLAQHSRPKHACRPTLLHPRRPHISSRTHIC